MPEAYSFNQIQFSYHSNFLLEIENLTIDSAKTTALIGPNGCGKSTLLHLLAFLFYPHQGTSYFFSNQVTERHMAEFRNQIAFVPQNPYLLRGSVEHNLDLTLRFQQIKANERSQRIAQVLEQLNIQPLKIQSAKALSGGELQKVALARALITQPKVLLMDEPFSYLDIQAANHLENFIKDYSQQQHNTLIFSTHDRLQGLAIADHSISLINGKQVESPLINLFQGHISNTIFNTGIIKLQLAEFNPAHLHASINPHEIVISRHKLNSSMRNQFQGPVISMATYSNNIRLTIHAGEQFHVFITNAAFKELKLSLHEQVWVNFKSNSIITF